MYPKPDALPRDAAAKISGSSVAGAPATVPTRLVVGRPVGSQLAGPQGAVAALGVAVDGELVAGRGIGELAAAMAASSTPRPSLSPTR